MNTPPANKVAAPVTAVKKQKKPQKSSKRMAAEAALNLAKSDQEKTLAKSHLKSVTFEDLARARVRKALKVLGHIENLANRAAYTWTEEQATKILNALHGKMKSVTDKLTGTKNTSSDFDL